MDSFDLALSGRERSTTIALAMLLAGRRVDRVLLLRYVRADMGMFLVLPGILLRAMLHRLTVR
jgi:hypothetical protein